MRNSTLFGSICGATLLAMSIGATAQAATLTYDFKFNVYRGSNKANLGQFNGNFTLENSGLTGVGQESVQIKQGSFDWLRSAVWYDPNKINNNYVAGLFPGLGLWDLAGSVAQILDGRFQGIMAKGYDAADKEMSSLYWYSNNTWQIQGNKFDATWNYGWSWSGSGSEKLYGAFEIQGPQAVVEAPKSPDVEENLESVPEPLTLFGSVFGLGVMALRKHKSKSS
jgi:hypothetical protein